MKRVVTIFFISIFTILYADSGINLRVDIDNLRNSNGVVQVTLYNKPKSIPDEKFTKYYKKMIVNIDNMSASAFFKNLPKGQYAVVVLHDEDSNGKIKKGFMLPKEGVGFSNFTSISPLNNPNFKKASFMADKSMSKTIQVIYF